MLVAQRIHDKASAFWITWIHFKHYVRNLSNLTKEHILIVVGSKNFQFSMQSLLWLLLIPQRGFDRRWYTRLDGKTEKEYFVSCKSLEHNLRHVSGNNTFFNVCRYLKLRLLLCHFRETYVIKHSNTLCYLPSVRINF